MFQGHPGQLQNEPDETYVRRVYARKTTETERDYYMRITSRYSSETDESYKSRITLIFNVFSDISKDQIKYDDNKKLFMYIQTKQGRKGVVTSTNTKVNENSLRLFYRLFKQLIYFKRFVRIFNSAQ